ncbi:MAG: flagellar basal body-associated FliL family protein [Rhodobacter sp.]|nr:flagellar basal body-associated FliL family protein [Rhodobacter sp.]
MAKLFPILIALVGLAGGLGAGLALRPEPAAMPEMAEGNPCGDVADAPAKPKDDTDENTTHDYVKLNNQFVVPIVDEGRVGSLVVMALSLEVPTGQTELVYDREPKLRDAFLQVMFDHANAGGFKGAFTSSSRMAVLRNALREVAQKTLGPAVSDVLIIDFVRQDA